jgi:tetratricopeptide (TPR) repeat protein
LTAKSRHNTPVRLIGRALDLLRLGGRSMRRLLLALIVLAPLMIASRPAIAENPGQADLDMATDLQVTAETLGDLEKVVKLAESALTKGLDMGQQEFAKKLLGSTLYQHANRTATSLFERRRRDGQNSTIRQQALKDLEKAKRYDPTLSDIYLLEAKLHAVSPGEDLKAASAAASEAITLLTARDDPKQLSKAYVLRAQITEDKDRKLADFDAAMKADPGNIEAGQAVAVLYIQKGENDKAVATLQKLLERDADNPALMAEVAVLLIDLKKFDEALKYCDDLIKQAPKATAGYNLRARVKVMKDDIPGAIKDLDEALGINGNDLQALLMRSNLHASQGNDELAKADVDKLLKQQPDLPQALLLKSMIAAGKKQWGEAILQMQVLLQSDPTNEEWRIRLASYYAGDSRPRKAIELLTQVLDGIRDENDPELKPTRADALRSRADYLLSVGKHAEAVKDYEEALKIEPDDTHSLNNLAWVLATSPDDAVRNAARSIELGLKGCELTKYEKPHIISTLAAGYAEKGDWETAKKWSAKAVEMGAKEDDIDDQLKKELESYKEKKPWREKQEVEENTKPIGKSKSELET